LHRELPAVTRPDVPIPDRAGLLIRNEPIRERILWGSGWRGIPAAAKCRALV